MSSALEPTASENLPVAQPAAADRNHRKPALPIMKYLPHALAVFVFALFFGAWEYYAHKYPSMLMPSPSGIWAYIVKITLDGHLWSATFVTMRRLCVGYLIGIVIGIPLGMLTARFQVAHLTLGTTALGLQTLPSVCWVPPALLWFGLTETAMLFIVLMGTVWAVILATDHGIRQVPPLYREAAETMGSRGLHLWFKVLIPAALPHIISGTKQGWAFAWRSLMAAEVFVFVSSGFGLGHLLQVGRDFNDMEQVMGIMVVIIAIGFGADKLIFSPWEVFLRRRWGLSKN
jgi:NitT/TauT family transport system permease protein